jgi:hypothetical protein
MYHMAPVITHVELARALRAHARERQAVEDCGPRRRIFAVWVASVTLLRRLKEQALALPSAKPTV